MRASRLEIMKVRKIITFMPFSVQHSNMRAMALVGLLILSSFGSVAAWQPQSGHGESIGLANGDIDSIPIEEIPNIPQHGFWILTREYPVPSNWIHDLADAGVECWSFLPDSAFHCELNGHTPSELAKMEVNGMVKIDY